MIVDDRQSYPSDCDRRYSRGLHCVLAHFRSVIGPYSFRVLEKRSFLPNPRECWGFAFSTARFRVFSPIFRVFLGVNTEKFPPDWLGQDCAIHHIL